MVEVKLSKLLFSKKYNLFIFQDLLFFWTIAFILLYTAGCSFTNCSEPRDLHEQIDKLYKKILNMNLIGSSTYNIIPEYRNSATKSQSYPKLNKKYKIYGISKCKNLRLLRRRQLNFKSTCPWYMFLDYDVNRIPQTMAKSECSCKECFNVHNSKMSGKCEKINSYVPVIRKSCLSGEYKYKVAIETVPVGCTCKRNRLTYMPS